MGTQKQLTILACLLVGIVVVTFSILATLQQTRTNSQLIRSRLAVTVEGAARPFNTVIELGLPVSMLRNRAEVLSRAHEIDNAIHDIALFNPSGIIVEQTGSPDGKQISRDVLTAMRRSDGENWSLETDVYLIAGRTILSNAGTIVGAIYARYPITELNRLSVTFRSVMIWASLVTFVLCGCMAWLIFRFAFRPDKNRTLSGLQSEIEQAGQVLASVVSTPSLLDTHPIEPLQIRDLPWATQTIPETTFSRQILRQTGTVFASLVLVALLVLTVTAQTAMSRNLEPEMRKRAELVSHILVENVQTAVAGGVPVEALTGLAPAMADLQREFPEISGLEMTLNGLPTHVGETSDITLVEDFSISEGSTGRILVSSNSNVLTTQFRKLVFDLAVIAVFTVLLAVEIAALQISRTVLTPINGLSVVARSVLDGQFRFVFPLNLTSGFSLISRSLSEGVIRVRALWKKNAQVLLQDGRTLPAPTGPLFRLRITSLSDIRLGLFLFAVADEAPLSFFALFVQDLRNPFTFLPDEIAITLPFSGYLFAALLCAPFARPLGQRIGYRKLFVAAALVTCVAKVGLFLSQGIVMATLWQSLNGACFVLAMLSCQDYALDMLPKQDRVRSMATFRAVLFSGVFAGTAVGGILADRLGEHAVFLFCAILALISATLILALLPRHQANNNPVLSHSDDSSQKVSLRFLLAFTDWRFCALAFGIIVPQAIIDHVFISYLLALLMDEAGASITTIAQVMMLFFLSLTLAGYAAGQLRFVSLNPALVLAISTLGSGIALWYAGQAPTFQTLLIVSVIAGTSLGLSGGAIIDIALHSAETRLSWLGANNVLGMVRVLERGGPALAMIAAGAFASFFGFERTTSAIGLYAIVAASVFLVFAVRTPKNN